jgi:hypothetical protein
MNASDYVEIGAAPPDEVPMQLGPNYEPELAIEECRRYIRLLRQVFGPEPEGATLIIRTHNHDFGIYHEVACRFSPQHPNSLLYALACEANGPLTWSDTQPRDYHEVA